MAMLERSNDAEKKAQARAIWDKQQKSDYRPNFLTPQDELDEDRLFREQVERQKTMLSSPSSAEDDAANELVEGSICLNKNTSEIPRST